MVPEKYKQLKKLEEALPSGQSRVCTPFSGYVINQKAMTDGHRDVKDHDLCVITSVGEYEGGELILYELGLVIANKPGKICGFNSKGITHLNTHFKGVRLSIVSQSDEDIHRFQETELVALGERYIPY